LGEVLFGAKALKYSPNEDGFVSSNPQSTSDLLETGKLMLQCNCSCPAGRPAILRPYPRQNTLAKALREIGRLERTLFTLDWISDPALRRRANAGLNKGEARKGSSQNLPRIVR
jgi:hypothetical protein